MSDSENRHYNPELDPANPASPGDLPERSVMFAVIIELVLPTLLAIGLLVFGYPMAALAIFGIGIAAFLVTSMIGI